VVAVTNLKLLINIVSFTLQQRRIISQSTTQRECQ